MRKALITLIFLSSCAKLDLSALPFSSQSEIDALLQISSVRLALSSDYINYGLDPSPSVLISGLPNENINVKIYSDNACTSLIASQNINSQLEGQSFYKTQIDNTYMNVGVNTFYFEIERYNTDSSCTYLGTYSYKGRIVDVQHTYSGAAALYEDSSVLAWGSAGYDSVPLGLSQKLTNVRKIYSTSESFLALKYDGTAVVWGDTYTGGEYYPIKDNLTDIIDVKTSGNSYAALKSDGTVFAWGDNQRVGSPGNASAVQSQLTNVVKIVSSSHAFIAIKSDGTAVLWGESRWGGDITDVPEPLINIVDVKSAGTAFSAVKSDGSIIYWDSYEAYSPAPTVTSPAVGAAINLDKIVSTIGAFAALRSDGTVSTWGIDSYGGDSSLVAAQLNNVIDIYATGRAFAALKADGSVVTWGSSSHGGDSSSVSLQLNNVQELAVNIAAFSALKADGTVIAWGSNSYGGDTTAVAADLNNVSRIFGGEDSLSALRNDGRLVVWGGHYNTAINSKLTNITNVFINTSTTSNYNTHTNPVLYTALKSDGTVVSWSSYGESHDYYEDYMLKRISNVSKIFQSNKEAYAAIKNDQTVVTWGTPWGMENGGDSSVVQSELINVVDITPNFNGFAALKSDGTVVSWGSSQLNLDYQTFKSSLTDVNKVYTNRGTFVALKSDGTVVVWGGSDANGRDISLVSASLNNIIGIYSSWDAFAALKADGTVVTWGSSFFGGDSSSVSLQLNNVVNIASSQGGFLAIKADGTTVYWGLNSGSYGATPTNVVSATGANRDNYYFITKSDGTVSKWGDSKHDSQFSQISSQLSVSSNIKQLAFEDKYSTFLKTDGNIVCIGGDNDFGTNGYLEEINSLTDIVEVKSLGAYSVGIAEDRSLYIWGHFRNVIQKYEGSYFTSLISFENVHANRFDYFLKHAYGIGIDGSVVSIY